MWNEQTNEQRNERTSFERMNKWVAVRSRSLAFYLCCNVYSPVVRTLHFFFLLLFYLCVCVLECRFFLSRGSRTARICFVVHWRFFFSFSQLVRRLPNVSPNIYWFQQEIFTNAVVLSCQPDLLSESSERTATPCVSFFLSFSLSFVV